MQTKLVISGNFDRRVSGAVHERISNLAALLTPEFQDIDIQGHQSSIVSRFFCCLRLYVQTFFTKSAGTKILLYGWPLPAITLLPLVLLDRLMFNRIIVDIVDWFDAKSNARLYNLTKNVDTFVLKRLCYGVVTRRVLISSKLKVEYQSGRNFVFPQIVRNFAPRAPLPSKAPLTLIYAGYPFPRFERDVPVANYKDRIDLIIAGVNDATVATSQPCVLHLVGLTKSELAYAMPRLSKLYTSPHLDIRFHGKVDQATLQYLIGQSHYFLLLRDKMKSSDYGFPTKVTDSLRQGVPIIYNDTSDLKIYLDQTGCVMCDLHQFSAVIGNLLLQQTSGSPQARDLSENHLSLAMFQTRCLKEFLA